MISSGSFKFFSMVRHGTSGRLEHVAISALKTRLFRTDPIDQESAGRWLLEVGDHLNIVVCAAGRPIKETNSPSAIVQTDVDSASTLPSAVSNVSETSRTSTARRCGHRS